MDRLSRHPAVVSAHTSHTSRRLAGPDVVRAVALIGVVVMNYRGYLMFRGDRQGDSWVQRAFDPMEGPLATRFAATFVLTAGVGVTLLTRRAVGDEAATTAMRWRLARRGLLLFGFGMVFDWIWPGTILTYYGAMFVFAAVMFTWRIRWLVATGTVAAVAAATIAWWRFERRADGHSTFWLDRPGGRSPRGLLFDTFVNGTHPLLPWLAFFCAGIILGRLLSAAWWRPVTMIAGVTMVGFGYLISGGVGGRPGSRAAELASVHPFDRGLVYTVTTLGVALTAFAAISWLGDRFAASTTVDLLRRAGEMTLTIYVAHALVFNLLVDWLAWIRPAGLDVALGFAATFWVVAIAATAWWQRELGRGPAERLYRALGG